LKRDDYWAYAYLVAVYDDFCVWCEASEGDYYRQGYTVDAAGEVTLTGTEQEVLPTWTVVGGADDEGSEDLVLRDPRRGVYKRLVVQGSRLVGAVLYGDVQDGPWYFDLIQQRRDIGALRSHLLFGQALCGQAA